MVLGTNNIEKLMTRGFSGIVFWMLFALQLHANPVPSGTIDLRQSHNLKVLFDGGLRPYRLLGLENQDCMINNANLTVILPNTAPIEFPVQYATFGVLAGNEVDSLELFGEYTSVSDAVILTKKICRGWRISTAGLDQEAAKIANGPIWESQGWSQDFQPSKEINLAVVTINPLYYNPLNKVQRGAYVNLFVKCGGHYDGVTFLTNPIQPPPGYENVSMDWPKPHYSATGYPSFTFAEYKARVQAALAKELKDPFNVASVIKSRILFSSSDSTGKPSHFWLILTGVLALALGVFAWFKLRRK